MTFVAHSYSDIPAKIMAEAMAKTREYDIFNQFPYVVPDAVSAEVIMPMDECAARGQPDFSGQAFSVMVFPSIVGYGNAHPGSKIKGQQLSCVIPGVQVHGKVVRRSPQAAGTGYMISRYSKHPELAYYFVQWLTGPAKGDEAIAHPQGFWEPMRRSNLTNEAIVSKFGQQFVEVALENTRYGTALLMLPGNEAYFTVLDKHLALVMQGSMSPEEAARQIAAGWHKVTDDVGRQEQIKLWHSGVASGAYLDQF